MNIKKVNCRFYVDEEKKVVVCVIPNTRHTVHDFLSDLPQFGFWGIFCLVRDNKVIKMPNSFIGKAVCSEQDEFDVEKGKKLAYLRAKDKFYRSFFKRLNAVVNLIDKNLQDLVTTGSALGVTITENMQKLKDEVADVLGE